MLRQSIVSSLILAAVVAVPLGSADAALRPQISIAPAASPVHWRRSWRDDSYLAARRAYGPLRYYSVRDWGPPSPGYIPSRGCGWVYKEVGHDRDQTRWVRYRACIGY